MAELVVVMITAPADKARTMARAFVERGLAACVNVLPGGHSVYRWQEGVRETEEVLLLVKTRSAALTGLSAAVRELHPYANPELITLPIEGGLPAYLSWLVQSVQLPEDEAPYFH
jgi:periplasmic divalent cation tolerance protein